MLKTFRIHRLFAGRMMLTLMLLQCLFVAVEASSEAFISTAEEGHHSVLVDDAFSDAGVTHNESQDSCDHCCQCHGHSSHMAMLSLGFVWPSSLTLTSLPSYPTDSPSRSLTSIYRPPIV